MENKQKLRPIFKLKCEVGVTLRENYKYPVQVLCESKTNTFLAFSIDFQFYLLEKNTIILQFLAEQCKCCFSNDEKYIAIIFSTQTTKLMLFDIEKKQQIWVQNCQNFSSLPSINFYRDHLIFMGNRKLFRYSINGELQFYQIQEKRRVYDYDEDDQQQTQDYQFDDEMDQYQHEEEFDIFIDRVVFQFQLSDDIFLFSKENYSNSYKTCYIFIPTTLKIVKSIFCKCGHLITKLSKSLILEAKLSKYNFDINNLFVVREIINHKILRMQRCNDLTISQFKSHVIKMALYCFNLDGFYKIDFTTGTQQFYNFSYPDIFQNLITTYHSRQNLFQEPYFYGYINNKYVNQQLKKMSLFKFVV